MAGSDSSGDQVWATDVIDDLGELNEKDFLVYEQQPMLDDPEEAEELGETLEQELEDSESNDASEIIYGSPEAVRYFQKAALPHGGAATIDVEDLSVRSKLVVRPLSSPDTYVDRHGSPGIARVCRTDFLVALTPELQPESESVPEPDVELETGQSELVLEKTEPESELSLVQESDVSPVLERELELESPSIPQFCPAEETEYEESNVEKVLISELESVPESEPEFSVEQVLEPEAESVIESVPLEMKVETDSESVEVITLPRQEPMNTIPVLESEPEPITKVEPDSEELESSLETAPVLKEKEEEEVIEPVIVAASESITETIPVPESSPEPVLELEAESDLDSVLENVAEHKVLSDSVLESQPELEIVPKEEEETMPECEMELAPVIELLEPEPTIQTDPAFDTEVVLDTEPVLEGEPEWDVSPPIVDDDEDAGELYTDEEDLENKCHAARVASCLNDIHRPTSDEAPLDERAERMAEAILASALFETVFLQPDDRSDSTPVPETSSPDLHFIGSSLCRIRFPLSGTCVELETCRFLLSFYLYFLFKKYKASWPVLHDHLPIQHPQNSLPTKPTKKNRSRIQQMFPLPMSCFLPGKPWMQILFVHKHHVYTKFRPEAGCSFLSLHLSSFSRPTSLSLFLSRWPSITLHRVGRRVS